MNKQQLKTSCNSHGVELFLQGRLNSSDTEILELHLTECESCARQIQLNAEHGVSWNEAQSLLAPDEYDSPQHIAAISSLLSDEHDPMTKHQTADVLSREIRGWLDPTDDPRSMGRFAGYEIVGIVGHGGMGIVLKGFEASLNRYVAIKILAPRLATNGSARKRFAREAQAAAAVRHDNVIAIHRVDEWHSLPFLVMPYAGGISLQKRIDSDGPLSIEQTLRVGVQIASGLAAAHAQGLIHRDIKPANILLEQGVERVTITDFGLARAADDASVTRTGVIAGTPQYMSPEQAEAKQLDARSDLFSLGSVLYAMATGRPPFRGAGSFEVLKRIVNEPARPMREIQSSVPEWFENIVNRLLSKSPDDRPSSASEVAELLQECLAHVQQPTVTPLPESITAVATSDNSRHRPSTFNRRSIFNSTQKGVIAMLGTIGMTMLGMLLWQATEAPDISGQWTSDEWGTVVLEAKEPGRYEGTFTGSDKDKPGYDISDILVVREGEFAPQPVLTETKLGTVELKWSRVERRFNGTWRKGINRNGKMSLRLVDNEIRGAWTTSKDAQRESDSPRLADLMWKRDTALSVAKAENRPLPEMLEALPAGSTTDEICSSTTPPEPTRILIELEMQRELKRNAICRIYDDHKDSFRLIVEPVYDKRLPVREYPIIGRASLHLLRYKCTVHFSPVEGIEWPLTKGGKLETEITLYVDSDHLHREDDGKRAVSRIEAQSSTVPGTISDSPELKISTAAELEKQIQLAGRELFYGRMELTQEFKTLRTTKDQQQENVTSQGTARWLKKGGMTRIESERMVPGTGTRELQPEHWTTGQDGDRAYSWNRVTNSIRYGTLRPGAMAYAPNLFFWGRSAIAFPQPMFGPNPTIKQAIRDGREEIDVVVEDTQSKLLVRYLGIVPDRGYLPTRVESRTGDRLDSQVEFQDFFQPRPGVWAAKTILWTAWSADVDGKPIVASRTKFTVTKLELGDDAKLEDDEFKLKLPDDVTVVDINSEPLPAQSAPLRELTHAIANPKPKRLQIREATVVEKNKDVPAQSEQDTVVEFAGRRLRIDRAQKAILTEDDIVNVESVTDPNNSSASQIVLTLTQEAGERFLIETTRLSSQPTPGYLAIEFDGTVLSALRVNDKISNKVSISASKDDDAEKLVSAIREAMEARVPDKPQAPDQPSMSKTLQQLQGKWRLTRQIAADGDEKITPANTTWEFNGTRIIARDGGPGGVMLIELDESHSPVHVDVALEGADESGLGLLSIEDDKLILCLGVSQKKPEIRSRPEKLQWVSGVWYMELQRVKPGESIEPETIEPVKPIPPNTTTTVSQTAINEAAVEALNMPSDKTSAPTAGDAAHTISGFVMEFRSGTPDVPVCLCDAATGMPVAKETYKPIVWSRGAADNPANEMAIVVSDSKGNFRFENVPDGKYRLIAQKWIGPYKGVFELHGAEIRLLGAVDEITVPRPADEQESRVVPTPLGENTIQFNQDVGNNETFLFLSTAPPEFDPILGLQGLGTSFWKNLIGVNRMPLGKTAVIGSPNKPVYAFMFAPDNSPGFAAITIPPPESGLVRLPAEPFVAGWSDGRKTPPPKLAELIEFMKTHELSVQQLLNIPEMSNANFKVYQARMQELTSDLSRTIDLPKGKAARVGDLLAADAYRKLQK